MSAHRGWTKFRAGSFPLGTTHPLHPEAVKPAEIGRARLPPSLMEQGLAGAMARQEARPPNFFTAALQWRAIIFIVRGDLKHSVCMDAETPVKIPSREWQKAQPSGWVVRFATTHPCAPPVEGNVHPWGCRRQRHE